MGVMTKLTNWSLPDMESREDEAFNLLSILTMRGDMSSTFGFVAPMGSPKYVKGIVPREHPKVAAKCLDLSSSTFIGTITGLL